MSRAVSQTHLSRGGGDSAATTAVASAASGASSRRRPPVAEQLPLSALHSAFVSESLGESFCRDIVEDVVCGTEPDIVAAFMDEVAIPWAVQSTLHDLVETLAFAVLDREPAHDVSSFETVTAAAQSASVLSESGMDASAGPTTVTESIELDAASAGSPPPPKQKQLHNDPMHGGDGLVLYECGYEPAAVVEPYPVPADSWCRASIQQRRRLQSTAASVAMSSMEATTSGPAGGAGAAAAGAAEGRSARRGSLFSSNVVAAASVRRSSPTGSRPRKASAASSSSSPGRGNSARRESTSSTAASTPSGGGAAASRRGQTTVTTTNNSSSSSNRKPKAVVGKKRTPTPPSPADVKGRKGSTHSKGGASNASTRTGGGEDGGGDSQPLLSPVGTLSTPRAEDRVHLAAIAENDQRMKALRAASASVQQQIAALRSRSSSSPFVVDGATQKVVEVVSVDPRTLPPPRTEAKVHIPGDGASERGDGGPEALASLTTPPRHVGGRGATPLLPPIGARAQTAPDQQKKRRAKDDAGGMTYWQPEPQAKPMVAEVAPAGGVTHRNGDVVQHEDLKAGKTAISRQDYAKLVAMQSAGLSTAPAPGGTIGGTSQEGNEGGGGGSDAGAGDLGATIRSQQADHAKRRRSSATAEVAAPTTTKGGATPSIVVANPPGRSEGGGLPPSTKRGAGSSLQPAGGRRATSVSGGVTAPHRLLRQQRRSSTSASEPEGLVRRHPDGGISPNLRGAGRVSTPNPTVSRPITAASANATIAPGSSPNAVIAYVRQSPKRPAATGSDHSGLDLDGTTRSNAARNASTAGGDGAATPRSKAAATLGMPRMNVAEDVNDEVSRDFLLHYAPQASYDLGPQVAGDASLEYVPQTVPSVGAGF